MKRFRGTATILISVALLALAACGDTDDDTGAGPAPAATTSAPAATTSAPAAGGADDAKLCAEANAAGQAWKAAWLKIFKSTTGDQPDVTALRKALTDFGAALNTAAGTGDSKAAVAAKQVAAQSNRAGGSADPMADDPAFDKALEELTVACKAVGVDLDR